MSAITEIERAAMRSWFGDRATEIAPGVVALCTPDAPDSPMLNRVWGLGVERPATEAEVDAALRAMGDTTFYVAVQPDAQPTELGTWLAARGLEPGRGWMQFERGSDEAPIVDTPLDVRRIGPEHAAAYARVQRVAYELPEAVEPWIESMTERPEWVCWLAFSADEAAAAGALFIDEDACYFGFAATLPEHRGKGGQSALLAARIEHARALGCTRLVTETGEHQPDRPNDSYRNLLRAGFRESYVVANWIRRR